MSDRNRADPHPDSPPDADTPDPGRSSVEGVEDKRTPLEPAGVEDGVGGTGGVNKAQDKPTS